MKQKGKNKSSNRVFSDNKALTKGVFISVLGDFKEDIKDLIESTAKRTETVLRKEIHDVRDRVDRTEVAISEHTRLIKGLETSVKGLDSKFQGLDSKFQGLDSKFQGLDSKFQGLDTKVQGIDTRLQGLDTKVQGIDTRLQGLDTKVQGIDTRLQGLEVTVKGLGEEMHHMEKRLSDKIYKSSAILENHETRICALETTHA